MKEDIKLKLIADKFLRYKVPTTSNCPAFFAYYMVKTGKKSQLVGFSQNPPNEEDTKKLIDEYLKAKKEITIKILRVSVMCQLDDDDNVDFYYTTISNPLYFIPIDKVEVEDIEKQIQLIENDRSNVDKAIKELNLNKNMLNFTRTRVDTFLDD